MHAGKPTEPGFANLQMYLLHCSVLIFFLDPQDLRLPVKFTHQAFFVQVREHAPSVFHGTARVNLIWCGCA